MDNLNCPNCHSANLAGAAQCVRCGYPLTAERTTAAAFAPGDLAAAQSYDVAEQANTTWSFAPDEMTTPPGAPAVLVGGQPFAYAAPAPYVAPFTTVGAALRRTWDIYINNFGLILKLVLFAAVPFALGQAAVAYRLGHADMWSTSVVLNTFAFWLVRCSLIPPTVLCALTSVLATGHTPTIGESYRRAAGSWLRVLLAVMLSSLLIMVGSFALFVPGIIIAVVYCLVIPVVLFEGRHWTSALQRSADLTRGQRWPIFGAIFVIWLTITIASLCTNYVATVISIFLGQSALLLASSIAVVIGEVFNQLWWVLVLVIYLGRITPSEQTHVVKAFSQTQPAP